MIVLLWEVSGIYNSNAHTLPFSNPKVITNYIGIKIIHNKLINYNLDCRIVAIQITQYKIWIHSLYTDNAECLYT